MQLASSSRVFRDLIQSPMEGHGNPDRAYGTEMKRQDDSEKYRLKVQRFQEPRTPNETIVSSQQHRQFGERKAVRRYCGSALAAVLTSVALSGCATPPTVGSLAVDRANEVVEGLVTAPTVDQENTFIRELVRGYQALGSTMTESDITSGDRAAMIEAGVKTCRELADGVSESAMRQKMEQDLLEQSSDLDPETAAGIIESNLRAIRAPGSLCP